MSNDNTASFLVDDKLECCGRKLYPSGHSVKCGCGKEYFAGKDYRSPIPWPLTVHLKMDGDQWCALLGENLQVGTAGFGDTMSQALKRLADQL